MPTNNSVRVTFESSVVPSALASTGLQPASPPSFVMDEDHISLRGTRQVSLNWECQRTRREIDLQRVTHLADECGREYNGNVGIGLDVPQHPTRMLWDFVRPALTEPRVRLDLGEARVRVGAESGQDVRQGERASDQAFQA